MLPEQWELALELAEGKKATPNDLERIARQTSTEAARWAFVQWELRARAASKFSLADRMLFDRDGLEMASHERIAEYHASLFPPDAPVADLTCGIGSDTIALARRGPAAGYEIDIERARMASWNLSANGLDAEISVGSGVSAAADHDFTFADPARRGAGGRARRLSEYLPDPRTLEHGRHRLRVTKLSPMLSDEELRSLGGEVRFISFERECREALVIAGIDAGQGTCAVHVETGMSFQPRDVPLPKGSLASYIYDPDPAAIRIRAVAALAADYGLVSADGTPFLTGEEQLSSPWLRGYEVLTVEKWDVRRLAAALAAADARTPDIKTHGHAIRPEEWVKRLKRRGGIEVAIFAIGDGGSLRAVVARPKE